MFKKLTLKNTFLIQCALAILCFVFARGCGSAGGEVGGCKPVSSSGNYTAATSDLDGKPWVFEIRPSSVEVSCANAKDAGEIVFSGVIKNGQGIPQAGLNSAAVLSGEGPNLVRKEKDKVVISDACGGVTYTLSWVCPGPGLVAAGNFVAKSGGLLSSAAKISIQNPTPTPNIAPVVIPLPGTAPSTPAAPVAAP